MSTHTQYACPSPTGRNDAQLFLTRSGTLVDKHGRAWGKSSIRRLALDAALAPEASGRTQRSTAEWAQSHARAALFEALEEACREHELTDDEHKELQELVDGHLRREAQEVGKGKGSLDNAAALDDDDEDNGFAEKVRSYLSRGFNFPAHRNLRVSEGVENLLR
jgi:hypothetical protein